MNTIVYIAMMIAIVIIFGMICDAWMECHKSNEEALKNSADLSRETVNKLCDKYHTCIDVDPDGKVHYFFGSRRAEAKQKDNNVESIAEIGG